MCPKSFLELTSYLLQDFGKDPNIEERGHVLRGLAFAGTSSAAQRQALISIAAAQGQASISIAIQFSPGLSWAHFAGTSTDCLYGPFPWTMRYKAETSFLLSEIKDILAEAKLKDTRLKC